MKRVIEVLFLLAFVCCFGSCTKAKEQENSPKVVITATPVAEISKELQQWNPSAGQADPAKEEKILIKREQIMKAMEGLKTAELPELALFAGKEASLANSNVLHNRGYLTYDEAGTIYFTDRNIGGIYVSDRYGKHRWQLTSDSGQNLQMNGEWLYYRSTSTGKVMRIHPETKVAEVVWELPCEAFLFWKSQLYINGFDGFYVTEPDGSNPILLHKQELMLSHLQVSENGLWLGVAYNEDDYAFMLDGHVLIYDETKNDRCYIKEGIREPLLAGNLLCFGSGKQKIWNIESDTVVELEQQDDFCVSDGTYLYACTGRDEKKTMYRFDGTNKTELFCMETDLYLGTKYLTSSMLYWTLDSAGEDWLYELWYYDLETGERGKIY